MRRAALASLAGLLLAVAVAGGAWAHAQLVESDPAHGATLDALPTTATLTFNEHIHVVPGAIRLFDDSGQAQELEAVAQGSELRIELGHRAGQGAYTLAWRVISADSHPVSGVVEFRVGDAAGASLEVPADSDAALGAQRLLKALHLTGILVLGGLALFAAVIAGPGQLPRGSLRRLVRASAVVSILSGALLIPVTAMAILGRPLGTLVRPDEWSSGITGSSIAVAAVTTAGAAATLAAGSRRGGVPPARGWLAGALMVLFTVPALTGHSMLIRPRVVTLAGDFVHVGAAAIWVGGTIGVGILLAGRPVGGAANSARTVRRFSELAAWSVGALAVTGLVLSLLIVPGWGALVETNYGRALVTKLGLVGATLGLAWWSRTRLLPRVNRHPRREQWSALRRVVAYETAILVLVIAVTAALVTFDPNGRGHEHPEPAAMSGTSQWHARTHDLRLRGELTGTELTFEVATVSETPVTLFERPQIRAVLPERDLGPLTIATRETGPGSYAANLELPVAGEWRLDISLRTGDFEERIATVTLEVAQPSRPPGLGSGQLKPPSAAAPQ